MVVSAPAAARCQPVRADCTRIGPDASRTTHPCVQLPVQVAPSLLAHTLTWVPRLPASLRAMLSAPTTSLACDAGRRGAAGGGGGGAAAGGGGAAGAGGAGGASRVK